MRGMLGKNLQNGEGPRRGGGGGSCVEEVVKLARWGNGSDEQIQTIASKCLRVAAEIG